MTKNNKQKKGFTLIELLVVIAIIAILAAVIIATTTGAQVQARDSRRVSDLDSIKTALELYNNKEGHYPIQNSPNSEPLTNTSPTGAALVAADLLSAVPQDPKNSTYGYWYCGTTDGSKYALKAKLETDSKSLESDYDLDWPASGVCDCNNGLTPETTPDPETSAPYTYCLRNP